jgi:hypothetical protein
MLSIKSVTLDSLQLDTITIRWEISSTSEDIMQYQFEVLRGESSGGPFEVIAGPFVDRYIAVDNIAPRRLSWRSLHYFIRLTNVKTNQVIETIPQTLNAKLPLEAQEMVRLMSMQLREFTGRPCLVFPVRTFGQRCTCIDPLTQRRQVTSCKLCYNTGYLSGYHYPMASYVNILPFDKVKGVNEMMITSPAATNAIMTIDPIVKIGDLIVEKEGTRWRVQSVRNSERLRSPVRQEVTLTRISEGDIEFSMPLAWPSELKTSQRMFSPKMDIGD